MEAVHLPRKTYVIGGNKVPPHAQTRKEDRSNLVIVVGCSRGYGKAIVQQVHYIMERAKMTQLILAGKSSAGMQAVAQELIKKHSGGGPDENGIMSGTSLSFKICEIDLVVTQDLEASLNKLFPSDASEYTHIYLICNSGTMGPFGRVHDLSYADLDESCRLNISSFLMLTSTFLKWIKTTVAASNAVRRPPLIRLINVSSVLAEIPMPSVAMYCATKAARNTFIKAIAAEASKDMACGVQPFCQRRKEENTGEGVDFKCLSFGPGPMLTEMLEAAGEVDSEDLAVFYKQPDDYYGEPGDRALMLWKLLEADAYESGEYVDFLYLKDQDAEPL